MKRIVNRIIRIDYLIHLRATGRPSEFASKIGISERQLYEDMKSMRELGAPIVYSQSKKTYYYLHEGRFIIKFSTEYGTE